MLIWRLTLGVLLIALLVILAWLDLNASRPGMVLAPLALVATGMGAAELVRLFESTDGGAAAPSRRVVVIGSVGAVLIAFTPLLWAAHPVVGPIGRVGWVALGVMLMIVLATVVEMVRFRRPGAAATRLTHTVFTIAYCGGLMGFLVQLRLLAGGPWGDDGRWGMVALVSLIAVVKANDTGAFTFGKLMGRHKMTPLLSPGKTWEGAAGGMLFSAAAAALCLGPLTAALGLESGGGATRWWGGVVAFAFVVGVAGVAGDLAVSLLKRDSGLKDSSTWMPGFGGVLDIVDSMLLAAPVAYALWVARVVGP